MLGMLLQMRGGSLTGVTVKLTTRAVDALLVSRAMNITLSLPNQSA